MKHWDNESDSIIESGGPIPERWLKVYVANGYYHFKADEFMRLGNAITGKGEWILLQTLAGEDIVLRISMIEGYSICTPEILETNNALNAAFDERFNPKSWE